MSWKLEIYRAFFVAFGMFQIIANARYLSIKDGIKLAAKQHQEIPKAASRKQLRIKVVETDLIATPRSDPFLLFFIRSNPW